MGEVTNLSTIESFPLDKWGSWNNENTIGEAFLHLCWNSVTYLLDIDVISRQRVHFTQKANVLNVLRVVHIGVAIWLSTTMVSKSFLSKTLLYKCPQAVSIKLTAQRVQTAAGRKDRTQHLPLERPNQTCRRPLISRRLCSRPASDENTFSSVSTTEEGERSRRPAKLNRG